MKRNLVLTLAAAATIASLTPAVAQTAADESRLQAAQERFDRETANFRNAVDQYRQAVRNTRDYRQPSGYYDNRNQNSAGAPDDRYENGYDPARYYRDGNNYQERTLAPDERVYRGNDGKYYCKRNDGTTGLVVGAGLGGVLGNVIDGGHSRVVGTLLGAIGGAFAGRAVERSSDTSVHCR